MSDDSYKEYVRSLTGERGEKLYKKLFDISQGTAFTPKLADGSEGEPVIPTLALQRNASLDLLAYLYGKADTQGAAMERRLRAAEMARKMTTAELEALVLNVGKKALASGGEDAQIVSTHTDVDFRDDQLRVADGDFRLDNQLPTSLKRPSERVQTISAPTPKGDSEEE